MNFDLLVEIKKRGLKQRDFARMVGDHESLVSRVINGHWNLDSGRKDKYAKVLGCNVRDLFKDDNHNGSI